jgi:hypothetical protein
LSEGAILAENSDALAKAGDFLLWLCDFLKQRYSTIDNRALLQRSKMVGSQS